MSLESWNQVRVRHEVALGRFVAFAKALDPSDWSRPIADDKWTPIEITEHLRAAYEIALKELSGGEGFRVRTGFVTRMVARLIYLPRILRSRRMPKGVKAPREIRPTNCIEDRSDAIETLQDFGSRVQSALELRRDERDAFVTHHLLGKFRPEQAMEFITIHLEHHTRQLPNCNE